MSRLKPLCVLIDSTEDLAAHHDDSYDKYDETSTDEASSLIPPGYVLCCEPPADPISATSCTSDRTKGFTLRRRDEVVSMLGVSLDGSGDSGEVFHATKDAISEVVAGFLYLGTARALRTRRDDLQRLGILAFINVAADVGENFFLPGDSFNSESSRLESVPASSTKSAFNEWVPHEGSVCTASTASQTTYHSAPARPSPTSNRIGFQLPTNFRLTGAPERPGALKPLSTSAIPITAPSTSYSLTSQQEVPSLQQTPLLVSESDFFDSSTRVPQSSSATGGSAGRGVAEIWNPEMLLLHSESTDLTGSTPGVSKTASNASKRTPSSYLHPLDLQVGGPQISLPHFVELGGPLDDPHPQPVPFSLLGNGSVVESFPGALYLKIPLRDKLDERLQRPLALTYEFLEQCLAENRKVFLYCREAKSRSVSMVLGYLMKKMGWKYEKTLHYVRSIRPTADPNLGFSTQLQEQEETKTVGQDEAKNT